MLHSFKSYKVGCFSVYIYVFFGFNLQVCLEICLKISGYMSLSVLMLTSKQRQNLKALAHSLDPVVHIGKNGLTEQSLDTIDKALTDHQLIKVKFLDFKDEKNNFASLIEERTGAVLIDVIGNVIILFRENSDSEKPLIY